MILEHLQQGEPGAWKIVFRASAEELARALEAQQAAHPEQSEEDRMAGAVNAAILDPEGFSPVWAEAVLPPAPSALGRALVPLPSSTTWIIICCTCSAADSRITCRGE